MMKDLNIILAAILIISSPIFANDKDNGGDICENRIITIRNDIKLWIQMGKYKSLRLPSDISLAQYKKSILSSINKAVISCDDQKRKIGKAQKTCINIIDPITLIPKISCHFSRFQNTNESEQYKLIHHEFAGIAGLEVNKGKEESDYRISSQITGYLKNVVIKMLVIQKDKYKMGNFKEVRTEFNRRYECGTNEGAPEKFSCEHGLRTDSIYNESAVFVNLHITRGATSLDDMENIILEDIEVSQRFRRCDKEDIYCSTYYITKSKNICEFFYHNSGEATFSCLDSFNNISYNDWMYFLPQGATAPGEALEDPNEELAPIETSNFGMVFFLHAPISKSFGADQFPKSKKTDALVKRVKKLFKNIGVTQIGFGEITSNMYIGSRIQLQYRKTGKLSIDAEDFSFGDQGYSTLYMFQDNNGESICWSSSEDEDDDMNICFNSDGSIDYTFLFLG